MNVCVCVCVAKTLTLSKEPSGDDGHLHDNVPNGRRRQNIYCWPLIASNNISFRFGSFLISCTIAYDCTRFLVNDCLSPILSLWPGLNVLAYRSEPSFARIPFAPYPHATHTLPKMTQMERRIELYKCPHSRTLQVPSQPHTSTCKIRTTRCWHPSSHDRPRHHQILPETTYDLPVQGVHIPTQQPPSRTRR